MVLNRAEWARLTLAVVAIALTSAAAGCKSGVVPGRAYEEPFDLPGRLLGALPEGAHPLASVVWTDPLERRPDVAMPAGWIDSTVAEATRALGGGAAANATVPFTLHLFRAPPAEALVEIPSPSGAVAVMAFGELVIVDDGDGDGTFQIDGHGTLAGGGGGGGEGTARDRYLAGGRQVLIYVARPFPPTVADGFDLVRGTKTGYQVVEYMCQGRVLSQIVQALSADLEPQTAGELVRRRTCMNTHSP